MNLGQPYSFIGQGYFLFGFSMFGLINKSPICPGAVFSGFEDGQKGYKGQKEVAGKAVRKKELAESKKLISQKISYLKAWGLHRTV